MIGIEAQLLIWWVLFGGTHVLGSSVPVRTRLIRVLGLRGFKAAYSIVALATFVPLVVSYWNHRHEGAMLFDPPSWSRHATELIMLAAVVLIVLAFATPNPATTMAEMSGRFSSSPRGIHRITRHPINTGFALFGIAHMISNPTVGDWIFWGGFPVYATISAVHQDRRVLATGPEAFRTFHAETSIVPFLAVLRRRQRVALRELPWIALVVATALFVALRLLHPWLIGGFG